MSPHLALLLRVWREPALTRSLTPAQWDLLIRTSRNAKLLGVLESVMRASNLLPAIPPFAQNHLESDAIQARFQRQQLRIEMTCIARALKDIAAPVILLKGAAYIAQDLQCARGRLPADLDLMVPRAALSQVEQALLGAGWDMPPVDAYTERYYREWTHELPPMRHPERGVELDLHHNLLPVLGRMLPDTDALFADRVPLSNGLFSVLCPEDQVLHACVHLFQDSDLSDRLRDLFDIHRMLEEFSLADSFWDRLIERATRHGFQRPLWYALHMGMKWLGTAVPSRVHETLQKRGTPSLATRLVMHTLLTAALPPHFPDKEPNLSTRVARSLLLSRSHLLRFPARLVALNIGTKLWWKMKGRDQSATT